MDTSWTFYDMNVLHQLKQQMQVVSNPRHREDIGGFHLFFVGTGSRIMNQRGWWRTKLNFFAIDTIEIPLRIRFPTKKDEFFREAGQIVLHAPNIPFEEYYETAQTFENAWIVFRGNRTSNPITTLVQKKGYCRFQDQSGYVQNLIHQTAQIADPDPALRWQAQSAFLQILSHLYQSIPSQENDLRVIHPLATATPKEQSPFQESVMTLLQNDLSSHISVEKLAHELGMSRSALSHRFSAEMGETLTRLTSRLRMERAQELIGKSDKQIKEIAFEVGFEDPAYFSKRFRATTGLSPRKFRELFEPSGKRISIT